MYYVEARFRDSDRVERFNLLQSSDAVVAWVSRNVASGMVLEVFVPSSATHGDLSTIRSLVARIVR